MSDRIRACIDLDEETADLIDSLDGTRADVLRRALREYLFQEAATDTLEELRESKPNTDGIEYVGIQTPPAEEKSDATNIAKGFYDLGYEDALDAVESELNDAAPPISPDPQTTTVLEPSD